MNTKKYNNMLNNYEGNKGPEVLKTLFNRVPENLRNSLSGQQLGQVMTVIDKSYHAGKRASGAEVDGTGIWIDQLKEMVEIDDIKKLIEEKKKGV